MIEEVFPHVFRMEIPLPRNPLKSINSYLIKGEDRFLMVDTGMNRPECMAAMESALKKLDVDLKRTDFFITHLHADHLGLVSDLLRDSSRIYFSQPDADTVQDESHWKDLGRAAVLNGFPEAQLEALIAGHPGRRYRARGPLPFHLVKENDLISIGEYEFRCVETPGHTSGHMCLYEPKARIFFSGDHILDTITPNISLWADEGDPLGQYLTSLDKIEPYDIRRVLPGHRNLFNDCRRRIAELKGHHETRAQEVISILQKGPQTAYQVASRMTWDIHCEMWEDFPVPQKWFASGEALAHLQYLLARSQATREVRSGRAFFSLPS